MNLITPKSGANVDIGTHGCNRAGKPSLEIRARPLLGVNIESAGTQNLLSSEEQDRLLHDATLLTYRRGGNTLFTEGQTANFLFVVDQGIIRINRYAENGRRQILAFRVAGDLFGLPENGQYVDSAETVGPAKIYRIPWHRMQLAMLAEPQIQLHLFIKVVDDFRQAEHRIMILGQQNTCQRLASFILDLRRIPEFFDEERSLLKLPVNRFDLADYLGAVPKSSERAFARLESQSLLRRVTARTIEILDISGLQRLQHERWRDHR